MNGEKINQEYLNQFDTEPDSDIAGLKRYLALFISNWYWFALSLFIGITIAYGLNRYGEPQFTVSSTILINDDQKGGGIISTDNIISGSNIFSNRQNIRNEIGILKSYNLNLRVLDSLPEFQIQYYGVGKRSIIESFLYTKCPFQVITDSVDYQPTGTKIFIQILSDSTYQLSYSEKFENPLDMNFGQSYHGANFSFSIVPRDRENFRYNSDRSNKFFFYFSSLKSVTNNFRRRLQAYPIEKDASLVNLAISGPVKEQGVDYLNKLMEIYILQGLEAKNKMGDSAIAFIDRQLNIIADSLGKAETALQNFRLENKLVDISFEGSSIQKKFETIEINKATLESKLNYYKYLKKYLETKVDHEDLIAPTVVGGTDQYLERLIEDISLLQKKQLELNMNLTEKLPPVSLQKENIEFTKKKLGENIENSIINIQVQINEEERKLKLVNIEMEKLPVTEKNLINIQRKFDINNTVYTYLLEKRAETGIAKASNVSNNKIVDQADYFNYTQIKPDKKKNQLKAFAISLLLPAVLILLLYYFNERIIDNTDIIRKTKVPVIGYISHSDEVKELPVYSNPSSSLSEGFRSIRTSLRYLIKDIEKPVIVITSTISSEGKTFMSANLAAITALSGKKVLLVGLDLRKPRIHKILGLENTIGLSNYLSNGCDYSEVIKKTAIENLDYATSGPVPPNPAELINEMKMKAFLDRAKADYDIVIIDTPPVAVVTDTFLLADYVDVNIFIVRQRYSSKNTLELIQEIYQNKKLKNMGIIINDISLSGYYGYGLRYGYYRGYGYSYGRNYYGKYSYSRYGYKDDDKGYYKKD